MSLTLGQVLAETDARPDSFQVTSAMRLLHSPLALRLLGMLAHYNPCIPARLRPMSSFLITLARQLYASPSGRVIWVSAFTPSELLWGLGLTPFYPEIGAAAGAAIGLSPRAIAQCEAPVDLCTFHRVELGLTRDGLFPPSAAFISTSHLCTIAGIMLASEARRRGKPFHLIDVPPTLDANALDYVEFQLKALVEDLCEATGVRYDPDRMQAAIRLSNEARVLALKFNRLRATRPAPVRGGSMLGLLGLSLWMPGHPESVKHFKAWRDYTEERIRDNDPEQRVQKTRLFWLHLRPYAESSLIDHLENDLDAVIAFEEHNTVWWDELDEQRPLRALAAKILSHPSNGTIERRLNMILDGVARYECDGVIHFNHWGCRQATGAVRIIRDRLRCEGIPMLELDGDCVDPANVQTGPLRTRIEAFVETLV